MNKKSFFLGCFGRHSPDIRFVIGLINQNSAENDDPVKFLEKPVSYENKEETSFKVFQVLGNAALANEISNKE